VASVNTIDHARIEKALAQAAKHGNVVAAYLFGPHAEGTADAWRDVDLAVFVERAESWGFEERARIAAEIQKQAGDDIEVHFFSAQQHESCHPATFAAHVIQHGIEKGTP
jgi:predicted nucleotidyltransferase